MLVRSTALAALAAATALAGGTTATVVLSASDQGVTASSERTDKAQAGAEHGKSADAGSVADEKRAAAEAKRAEATDTTAPACGDAESHGAYVSAVAKAKAEDAEPGAHGKAVSAAAKSDCGKSSSEDADDADEADEDEKDAAKADAAESGKANANERGQAGQQLGASHGKSAEKRAAR